jgi:membrane-associated phospholipid phosphatase
VTGRRALALLTALLFAGLAIAVAAGAFTGLDQWSVDHLMPGAIFTNEEAGLKEALIPLWGTHWDNAWSVAANVVTFPASFLVALALCLWRSRALAVVVVVGTAVEALCKEVLVRPALHTGAFHISGFDASFPSGHTLRTVLVAALVAQPFGAAWAVASIVLLQLAGWHTPTDIAGGIVLGLLAVLVARALPDRARRASARRGRERG